MVVRKIGGLRCLGVVEANAVRYMLHPYDKERYWICTFRIVGSLRYRLDTLAHAPSTYVSVEETNINDANEQPLSQKRYT